MPGPLKCEECGIVSDDVTRCIDPYELEIYNVEIEITVCDKCYNLRSHET